MTTGTLIKPGEFLYFAYGSNMFDPWLQRRCTSARAVGVCLAPGYRFSFSKRSDDGSGKGNIARTDNNSDAAHGVLFAIAGRDADSLADAEKNYDATPEFVVRHAGTDLPTLTYIANPDFVDERLRPYDWYHELTIIGAVTHALPPGYVEGISNLAPIADPRLGRKLRLLALELLAEHRAKSGR